MSIVTEAEVARKLIGKQKKTKQEVVDGLSLDQHECAVWQCVFREDDEMCILLERAMQRKLAEEHAKNISSTLEKSKTDIQRDAVWHIHYGLVL